MNERNRVFVAGHRGLVGSAIARRLSAGGYRDVLTRERADLDLRDRARVGELFADQRPECVILAAARVGGIVANDSAPAEFIRDNLLIQTSVIDAAHEAGVAQLAFLGSSCIYPRDAAQPMREDALLTGPLEPTNSAYAVAKIAGIEMCRAYRRQYGMASICVMPTNLYGPGDNFDLTTSHVLPALLRKFHEAKLSGAPSVAVWGSGRPRREFLHVDDLADAVVYLMERHTDLDLVNVGCGSDLSIAELAALIRDIVGYVGEIELDPTKPDGTPRKLLDITRLTGLGWRPRIALADGIRWTYQWYLDNQ